jgi:hypothetical protein
MCTKNFFLFFWPGPSLQNRAKIVKNRANPGNLRPKTGQKTGHLRKTTFYSRKTYKISQIQIFLIAFCNLQFLRGLNYPIGKNLQFFCPDREKFSKFWPDIDRF